MNQLEQSKSEEEVLALRMRRVWWPTSAITITTLFYYKLLHFYHVHNSIKL